MTLMRVVDLPAIEREAIDMLLDCAAQDLLRRQLGAVSQVHRTETGAGIYVIFEIDGDIERLQGRPSFHIADVFATSAKCDEIGFILFVKEGLIEYMEAYVHSDVYPAYEGCDFTLSRQSSST